MEIRREIHLLNGYYHSFEEKEDDLQRALSSFVRIAAFNITRFFTHKNLNKAGNINISEIA